MKLFGQYRDLIRFRALLESRIESRQFYFGLLWWIVEPIANLAMMYLVFGIILERGGPGFAGFLLVGFVFWRWIDTCVKKSLASLQSSAAILTQVNLPAWLFPFSDILAATHRFLIILALLSGFCIWYSGSFGWAYLALPLVLFLNLLFLLGFGLTLSLLPPFMPDSRKIIDNLFALLFFASGIFFDIASLEPRIASILYLNPIASFLSAYRMIMLDDQLPSFALLQLPMVLTAVFLTTAAISYHRCQNNLAKVLLR